IPIYYDPMIAKLVTFGKDRKEAIERMIRAIDEYEITGIETTLAFGKFVMQHEAFTSGHFDTHFVGKYFKPEMLDTQSEDEAKIAAILGTILMQQKANKNPKQQVQQTASSWKKNRKSYQ
ncbi:MAG: biotin carboxylase, partial [Bacteroidetes bacterium]|nr:biotin carboxylase [Bacteroidota bacterium]MBU1760398.1 biotin carboxylase [Bacteroidota bacterium]